MTEQWCPAECNMKASKLSSIPILFTGVSRFTLEWVGQIPKLYFAIYFIFNIKTQIKL